MNIEQKWTNGGGFATRASYYFIGGASRKVLPKVPDIELLLTLITVAARDKSCWINCVQSVTSACG